jgi:hypothetical protein
MDSDHITTNVLARFCQEFIPRDIEWHPKPLIIPMDNCSIRTSGVAQRFMSEHQMSRMPHPSYSIHLVSRYFDLFPTVKDRLERIHTVDGDDLFQQLLEIGPVTSVDEVGRIFTV